ncbi:MAG: ATP-binding cassette domain-containing protein [Blautia marasmi]
MEDISIHLEQGELVSFCRVSGSGKTTLFNMLPVVSHDEGKVYLKIDVTSHLTSTTCCRRIFSFLTRK